MSLFVVVDQVDVAGFPALDVRDDCDGALLVVGSHRVLAVSHAHLRGRRVLPPPALPAAPAGVRIRRGQLRGHQSHSGSKKF